MSYTLQSTKIRTASSIIQEKEEKEEKELNNKIFLYCDYCKNPMQEWGTIHIKKLERTHEIKFLCSPICKRKYIWTKPCPECGKLFDTKNRRGQSYTQTYCSRKCYYENRKQERGPCKICGKLIGGLEKNKRKPKLYCSECIKTVKGSYKYNTHYFCDSCRKWIKKEHAVRREDTKRKNYFVCPKLDCNGNRLKINSEHSKYNKKRKDVKYIE